MEIFGHGITILSESAPFDLISNRSRAARRRNFFAELLPEGIALDNLAAEIRVSTDDIIALLAQFGRGVAGAIQVYDPEAPGEPCTPALAPVDAAEVGRMLANTQAAPLDNRPKSGRTSLAGVQGKIVPARQNNHWFQVLEGHPSTQIVKPQSVRYPTITFDEGYGGKVSLKRVADVVGRDGDRASVEQLLRLLTLSQAVGNLDMHGKNISTLHFPDGNIRITPPYAATVQGTNLAAV
ncbi:hypothetical protein RCH23_002791 [Cryobacterium sp. CAN_C3]|uniref:HipA domain-containing protein n=1 Tax=unclassified Cryobacterium TaxID=2649013 RepID=UPI0018CB773A|nr:HipA domain-containing protein [Cryobacterium sp. CAN_C3]MEC5155395.1 hypothetical protein [Cryobacterium sp. CAN_C3]